MISREVQALRDEFKKETTLPHSRPGQGHTQYYAEWLEIKLSEKQNNWISVDRCNKCKNKHSHEDLECVIFCNENKDPSRYDKDRNHYETKKPTPPPNRIICEDFSFKRRSKK